MELQLEEAQALVEQYNREGKQATSATRRFRGNDRSQPYDNRSSRSSYSSYGLSVILSILSSVRMSVALMVLSIIRAIEDKRSSQSRGSCGLSLLFYQ